MTLGRNDPCPCGSGKKYKKCCFRKDQLAQRVETTGKQVDEELDPDASIYKVWLQWRAALKRGDFNFCYDLSIAESSLRQTHGDRAAFVDACAEGKQSVPAGESATFQHLAIVEGQTARLLQVVGAKDASVNRVRCECLGFAKTDAGWRLSGFEAVEVDKDTPIALSLFPA